MIYNFSHVESYIKELNDVRVAELLKDLDLPVHSLKIWWVLDHGLVKDFDRCLHIGK